MVPSLKCGGARGRARARALAHRRRQHRSLQRSDIGSQRGQSHKWLLADLLSVQYSRESDMSPSLAFCLSSMVFRK